jgi:hypothetical protein
MEWPLLQSRQSSVLFAIRHSFAFFELSALTHYQWLEQKTSKSECKPLPWAPPESLQQWSETMMLHPSLIRAAPSATTSSPYLTPLTRLSTQREINQSNTDNRNPHTHTHTNTNTQTLAHAINHSSHYPNKTNNTGADNSRHGSPKENDDDDDDDDAGSPHRASTRKKLEPKLKLLPACEC